MDFWLGVKLLLLLITANGAPILLQKLCGTYAALPIDAGRTFRDGRRWLGDSKTWRGLAAAVLLTPLAALLLQLPTVAGVAIAVMAMFGDLLSSFIKRRLDIPSSGMALGLDQIPESLLPLLAVRDQFSLGVAEMVELSVAFLAVELVLSLLLYRLDIRKRPY